MITTTCGVFLATGAEPIESGNGRPQKWKKWYKSPIFLGYLDF